MEATLLEAVLSLFIGCTLKGNYIPFLPKGLDNQKGEHVVLKIVSLRKKKNKKTANPLEVVLGGTLGSRPETVLMGCCFGR